MYIYILLRRNVYIFFLCSKLDVWTKHKQIWHFAPLIADWLSTRLDQPQPSSDKRHRIDLHVAGNPCQNFLLDGWLDGKILIIISCLRTWWWVLFQYWHDLMLCFAICEVAVRGRANHRCWWRSWVTGLNLAVGKQGCKSLDDIIKLL